MVSSKKLFVKGFFGRCIYVGVYLQSFCLGWFSNFVGSESGQIQSVKLLAKYGIVSNRTHNTPTPPSHLYILYFDTWKGGGGGE
jgi:hypothetical protein